ncbi:MAG: caspase family protein [Bacteroidales bacterium]|nr:caspase family protein [Bacteroidales bacterium]
MKTKLIILLFIAFSSSLYAQLSLDKALYNSKHKTIAATYSHDGKYIASSGENGDIIVWDVKTGSVYKTLKGLKKLTKSLKFSKNGKYLITGGKDNNVTVWSLMTGERIKTIQGHKGEIYSVDISNDDKYIASGSSDKSIIIWNMSTGEKVLVLTGHNKEVTCVDFNRNGKKIISGSADKTLKEWNTSDGSLIQTINAHNSWVKTVAYSSNGKYIASGGYDKKIYIWDAHGQKLNTFQAHKDRIMSVAFSPDSKYLISGSQDAYVLVWDVKTGMIINKSKKQKSIQGIYSVAFSPDGKNALSTSLFNQLNIWDVSELNVKQVSDEMLADAEKKSEIKATINWLYPTIESSVASSPVFRIKACINSKNDISDISVYLNDELFSSDVGSNIFATSGDCTVNYEKNVYLKQGTNNIKIVVNNEAGSTESQLKTIEYSMLSKPVIVWVDPINSDITTKIPAYNISANIKSKSPVSKIEVYINDQLFTQTTQITGNLFTKTIKLVSGLNQVKIVAVNSIGSTASSIKSINLAIAEKPLIAWLNPVETTTSTFMANFYIQAKIKSESPLKKVDIYLNDVFNISVSNLVADDGTNYNIENNLHLNHGINKIKLIAENESGQTISEIKNIDYSIPSKTVVSWIFPNLINTEVNKADLNLRACIKSDSDLKKITLYVNNVIYSTETQFMSSQNTDCTVDFNKSVHLNPGQNQIKIIATNIAGDTESEIKFINYSIPVLAQVTWLQPFELKTTVSEPGFDITACIKSNIKIDFVQLYINNVLFSTDQSFVSIPTAECTLNFTKHIQLNDGDNQLKLVVGNIAGNSESQVVNIKHAFVNPYRFALIIGNEDYSSYQTDLESESDVDFAKKDAKAFKDVACNILGVPDENIIYLENARYIEMRRALKKMNLYAKNTYGKGEFYFFYAGHGFPDEKTKDPYLVPVDGSGSDLEFSAIKLKDVYNNLTEFPTKRVTVFLDACFSGGARNQGLIAARGVKIKPNEEVLKTNLIVFAASSGNQSSLPYKEKQHGMFSYYLIKKLKESKGNISYKELSDYVKEQVGLKSIMVNNKEQNPQTNVSPSVQSVWGNWKVK